MAATIDQFCKACNGRHEFYLPVTAGTFLPHALEYTCPQTSRRMDFDVDGEWNDQTPQMDDGSVILRRVPR